MKAYLDNNIVSSFARNDNEKESDAILHSPFAQSTSHILNCKLPVELSPQPQPLQDGFLPS